MGDGADGLAAAIFGAMICMVLLPASLLGGVGYLLARRRRWIGALVGVAIGLSGGALAVLGTFYESTWSPPPTLTVDVPPGFAHEWVYVVSDPRVTTELAWTGHDLPFTSRHADIAVPRSGVVRLRSVESLENGAIEATLTHPGGTSPHSVAFAALTLPTGGRVIAIGFARWPGREPEPSGDPDALAARITALEAER